MFAERKAALCGATGSCLCGFSQNEGLMTSAVSTGPFPAQAAATVPNTAPLS
jgi:hypothetical protein